MDQISGDLLKYRNEVLTHLEYIKEKVDSNHAHLERVNGRLREAEKTISAIKAVGTSITVAITIVLTWLGIAE